MMHQSAVCRAPVQHTACVLRYAPTLPEIALCAACDGVMPCTEIREPLHVDLVGSFGHCSKFFHVWCNVCKAPLVLEHPIGQSCEHCTAGSLRTRAAPYHRGEGMQPQLLSPMHYQLTPASRIHGPSPAGLRDSGPPCTEEYSYITNIISNTR